MTSMVEMVTPALVQQHDFLSELQASGVYTRATAPQLNNDFRRRRRSFHSEAAIIDTASFGSSLTLLDSRASTHPSNQSTLFIAPQITPSAAEYSVDAALYSFRAPSLHSLSSTPGHHISTHPRHAYNMDIYSLPRPLGRPRPVANPPAGRTNNLNFSAQRARPRSYLQPLTLSEIQDRISLLQACQYGDTTRVTELLAQGVDPNTREFSHGAAAIHIATIEGHYDVVRSLLRHGARVDEPFRGFRRPLHEAVRRGDSALTVLLLDNGAAVDARDERGYQPLHVAVTANEVACAKLLVWAGAPINSVGNDFLTPLHHVAFTSGNMELVDLLIEHGADVHVRTRWLLGNKLGSEIAREKGHRAMEVRLSGLDSAL